MKQDATLAMEVTGLPLPVKQYPSDAGYDLWVDRTVTIPAHGYAPVPCTCRVATPDGTWALIIGRSSTFHKRRLLVIPAVIDGGWRGDLWAMVYNTSNEEVTVRKKERVAQLILIAIQSANVVQVEKLRTGDRGENGFGSTGV